MVRSKEKRLYSQGKSNDKAVKEKQIQRKFCLGVLKFLQGAGGFFHLPLSQNFGGDDKQITYHTAPSGYMKGFHIKHKLNPPSSEDMCFLYIL